MRLFNVACALHCEPWLIQGEKHRVLSQILEDHISGLAHTIDGRAAAFSVTPPAAPAAPVVVDGVRIIDVAGVMGQRVSLLEKSSGVTDVLDITKALRESDADSAIAGVVMNFDTPGGRVTGVPELAAVIRGMRKPVAAFSDSICASAGYWPAAQCDMVFGSESSIWGSVGVYSSFLDKSRAYEMAGVKVEMIKSGKFKGQHDAIPLTDEARAQLQSRVDMLAGWFKADLAARGIPDEAMQGQTFFGREAAGNRMIDRIGTLEDAMAWVRQFSTTQTGEMK